MILVTGATGHTGRRVVRTLLERGRNVRIMTRQPAKLPLELRQRIEIVRGNLQRPEETREAVRGCEAVIAMTHIKLAPPVIAAMQAEQVRRGIFMSSTRRFTQYPEETARQVIEGEDAVRASGLDWTIIRPSMIYGSRRDNNLAHLVEALRRWPVHPLFGGGKMKWQPVYTWDVARAVVAALERPQTVGKEYTIAGPEPITYEQMVRVILRQMKRRVVLLPVPLGLAKPVIALYEKLSRHPRLRMDQILRMQEDKVFDISEARHDLGFQPTPFEEGIRVKLADKV